MNPRYLQIIFAALMMTGVVFGACPAPSPFIYTIEEAVYDINISNNRLGGELLISGSIVSGEPRSIHLFGEEVVVTDVERCKGGQLTLGRSGQKNIDFVPELGGKEFQVIISFLLRPQEDARSRFIRFSIPPALKNTLKLELGPDITIIERPGIIGDKNISHFGAATGICVRYADSHSEASVADLEVDSFSLIKPQSKRSIITTTFAPVRPLPVSFILRGPKNSQLLSSSLKSSWIEKGENSSYKVRIPSSESGKFWTQFAVEDQSEKGQYSIMLPAIDENNGREGDFIVEEPEDGRISIEGKGLMKNLSVGGLHAGLRDLVGNSRSYGHLPVGSEVQLQVSRFAAVSTPPIVLDSQIFYVAFEENGNVLTVLEMNIPPDMGSKLKLKAVADTEIWSLSVNGRRKKVYKDKDDRWIIPLEEGEMSCVRLALLRKSEKLGLHGRLELALPETGLSSKVLKVGIALPPRVQLLSLEGPVSPDSYCDDTGPEEFIGKPYYFSRAFYQGQGMNLAVFYKEPVKQ